jgi:hypothetical protein
MPNERGHGKTKRIRDAALIAVVAAAVEEDRWVTVRERANGVSNDTCEMVKLREKRPQLAEKGFVFHWDNAPVHTAAVVKDWFAANAIPLLEHPPYSPDLAPADFFLFPKVKEALAGNTIAADGVKNAWMG